MRRKQLRLWIVVAAFCFLSIPVSAYAGENSVSSMYRQSEKEISAAEGSEHESIKAETEHESTEAETVEAGTAEAETAEVGTAEAGTSEAETTGAETAGAESTELTDEIPEPAVPPVLSKTSKSVFVGDSFTLKLKNADASKIVWKSSKKKVAIVEGGKVTALSKGTATITAKYKGVKYTCEVVVAVPYLNEENIRVEIGDFFKLKLKGAKAESFEAEDTSVAKVSAKGLVKGMRAGETKVLVSTKDKVYVCRVSVVDTKKAGSVSVKRADHDIWLLKRVSVSGRTIYRNTGLDILVDNGASYVATDGKDRFNISKFLVTEREPAYVPLYDIPTKDFKVTPGILVNFEYNIVSKGNPTGLVNLGKNLGTKHMTVDESCMFNADAIEPLRRMIDDCWDSGAHWFNVTKTGAYRPYSMQEGFWNARLAENPFYGDNPYREGGVKCLPAYSSEHRTGYAIDIQTTEDGYKWLNKNSYRYGFILRYTGDKTKYTGVMDEYWHYTYVGVDVATTCFKEKLCLEEYYDKYVNIK